MPTQCIYLFRMILIIINDYFPKQKYELIFVTVKSCVFFAVGTEYLNVIHTSFGFKGLM
jgi:hypothetical protein